MRSAPQATPSCCPGSSPRPSGSHRCRPTSSCRSRPASRPSQFSGAPAKPPLQSRFPHLTPVASRVGGSLRGRERGVMDSLDEEQAYVDYAYECLDAMRARTEALEINAADEVTQKDME